MAEKTKKVVKPQAKQGENSSFTVRHLMTDYPAGEEKIKQLERGKMLVPCSIESEDDYYIFTYDASGLMPYEDAACEANLLDKYAILISAGELIDISKHYSFTLNPRNILVDEAYRPKILERSFPVDSADYLTEYKALIGSTLDIEHSYEDYLKGGADLYGKNELLSKVYSAKTEEEIYEALCSAITKERSYREKTFVMVRKSANSLRRVLLPVLVVLMVAALGLAGYEHFAVGRANERKIEATELYFSEDYKSVGGALSYVGAEELSPASRYMAAVSAVKSSGLTAEQKENILKALDRHRTNKDYLSYWVMIGRADYEEADQYAQKFQDNEHRIFALALRKAQVEKDATISGSEKTETVAKLEEEIKKLMEAASEDKYGLRSIGGAEASSDVNAEVGAAEGQDGADSQGENDNQDNDAANTSGEPKLLD